MNIAPIDTQPQVDTQLSWTLPTRIAFRLCFIYFILCVVTTQMLGGLIALADVDIDLGSSAFIQRIVTWTGTHVFHIGYAYSFANTGSGDKTADYIQVFCLLMFAAAVTVVWSVLDRRRPHYQGLNKWFRVFLRFALGSTMLTYGMVKAFPLQMSAPGLTRLLEPYGNFSPMGVLWASIGASSSYERFAGVMELTGGILLFIPRLTTLGAMVTFADTVQIFLLNMTYDVPVKLFSLHLLLMSLLLLAPEASRIANLLVFNRRAEPSTQPPLFRGRRAAIIAVVVQLVYGGYLITQNYRVANESWTQRNAAASKSPLYGIWNIETMKIDGHTRAPLVTDYGRWRRVVFQTPASVWFQRMDDSFFQYPAKIDPSSKTLTITPAGKDAPVSRFAIERPDAEHLILDGQLDGHAIRMEARLFDRNSFLLVSRGQQFNWIQERPFNR